jgi:hypothetical protein
MKVKKKNLLVERQTPFIVRQAPTDRHNEVTVAVIHYALPLMAITKSFNADMLQRVKKVASSFPDANVEFNFKAEAPAFLFTCKAKTERRGDDTPNQEVADRIAIAKCRAKACKISWKLIEVIRKVLIENVYHTNSILDILQKYQLRELSYIQKV